MAGVNNLAFRLFGQHLDGHPGTVNPNSLETIFAEPINANAGARFSSKAAKKVRHRHDDGTHGIDSYSLDAAFSVGTSILKPLEFAATPFNALRISGIHEDLAPNSTTKPPQQTGMTTGASESFVFYNADTNSFFFSPGEIDTAQRRPANPCGRSCSRAPLGLALAGTGSMVDPDFAGDPLIEAFSIFRIESPAGFDQVSYVRFDADRGMHVFGGGTLAIDHFGSADFTFNATFEEMLYHPASGEFFAILDTVRYTDFPEQAGYSAFLDQFTDAHLFGDDPSSRGIVFTFNMPGLVEATKGFTQTFFPSGPLGMYLTGVLIPEPASSRLLAVGSFLLWLRIGRGCPARLSRNAECRNAEIIPASICQHRQDSGV